MLKEDQNNVSKRSSLNTKAKEFLDKQAKVNQNGNCRI